MSTPAVPHVRALGLTKQFRVPRRAPGLRAAMRALFRREYSDVAAVRDLSFTLAAGERVGFLGPNGAGKTTTLKLLAGLLHPSAGTIEVAGFTPASRAPEFLRTISLVMGQKRQLSWDLPAVDTFAFHRVVYDIEPAVYRRRLDELVTLLAISEVMHRPVRQLSLGERMKCELVAALLHGPTLLFLDEPTIGMDVAMQLAIREFIRRYNREHGATILLTSHYMEDVAALCPRILVIDGGSLRFDGTISELTRRIRPLRRVSVYADALPAAEALAELGHVITADRGHLVLDVAPPQVPAVVQALLALPGAHDLGVHDAPLEEVMRELFQGGV